MEIVNLGSIYLDSAIQTPGFVCKESAAISLGDTVPDQEISWVKLKNGLLIADRYVCTNISWEQLDKVGFVFGTPITIDGETYWCRCLQVGSEKGIPNEWDSALDEIGEDDALWHWEDAYFWGRETSKYGTPDRAVRGYYSARFWSFYNASFRSVYVGFRPVLESLGSEPCSPDTLLGKKTRVYGSGGVTIEGCLIDFSDYDVTLEVNPLVSTGCSWIAKEGCNIIAGRENIIWLKEC